MGEGNCYIDVSGEISCQENADDENGFQITPDTPLHLQTGKKGVSVEFTTADIVVF